nr:tripartite tricarboxylate transporter substrate binding protein [Achromobacter xylosoxidans]
MRALCQAASAELGQPIVVENRPGVSGMLGLKAMVSSAPDGYTIGQVPLSVTRFSQLGTIQIDLAKDLDYIARAAGLAFGIAVRVDSPWKTLDDMVQAALARPDHYSYASPGMGNQTHIGMEILSRQVGMKMMHVPFKGGSEATQALLGGHVDAVADSSTWAPFVLDGRLRLLATWGEQRLARFPDVPTLKEQGYALAMSAPGGVAAPAGLPPAVREKLREAFRAAVLSPQHKAATDKYDMTVMYEDAGDYKAFVAKTYAEETRIIEDLKLREILK